MDPSVDKIEISLLGPWQLRHSAGPTKKEPRRKEQGLLAYLAVESGQAHSRDSLIRALLARHVRVRCPQQFAGCLVPSETTLKR